MKLVDTKISIPFGPDRQIPVKTLEAAFLSGQAVLDLYAYYVQAGPSPPGLVAVLEASALRLFVQAFDETPHGLDYIRRKTEEDMRDLGAMCTALKHLGSRSDRGSGGLSPEEAGEVLSFVDTHARAKKLLSLGSQLSHAVVASSLAGLVGEFQDSLGSIEVPIKPVVSRFPMNQESPMVGHIVEINYWSKSFVIRTKGNVTISDNPHHSMLDEIKPYLNSTKSVRIVVRPLVDLVSGAKNNELVRVTEAVD